MSQSIAERADAYARGDANIRQAYIDGYNDGFKSRSKKKEIDLSFVAIHFLDVMTKWLEYKKERRSSYTQRSAESVYKKLFKMSGGDPVVADEIVEQSISNNWQGLFELKNGITTAISTTQQERPVNAQSVAGRREGVKGLATLAGAVLRGTAHPYKQ